MKRLSLQAFRYGLAAAAVTAAIYLMVLLRADSLFRQDTAVSVAAAVHLQPRNAEYIGRLASWQPANQQTLLRRAVRENPFDGNDLIRLGLLAEMQDGDSVAAEGYYRQAAQVNRMFLPRWTLTNFYFRQQRVKEFFEWSRATLAVTPYASDPVFAQMRLMTQDENTMEGAIPERASILLQYVWYLSNAKQFDSIPRAVNRLVQKVGRENPDNWGRNDMLAATEDRMLAAGYLKPALDVWSSLHSAGWLSVAAPSSQHPLTNGDFRARFFSHGFDWVRVQNAGTRVEQFDDSGLVRVNFFGDEAEKLTLLQQYMPLEPGRAYAMTWDAQGENLSAPSGLAWHLHSTQPADTIGLVSGDLLPARQQWDFRAPPGKVFLLTLEYSRPLGVTRSRGSFVLKPVNLTGK